MYYFLYHQMNQHLYTIVLIYFIRDHHSKEQLFIIVLLLNTLNLVDKAYYRNFCTTLRALNKLIITNFFMIAEIAIDHSD